jgi:hypothetical protein
VCVMGYVFIVCEPLVIWDFANICQSISLWKSFVIECIVFQLNSCHIFLLHSFSIMTLDLAW